MLHASQKKRQVDKPSWVSAPNLKRITDINGICPISGYRRCGSWYPFVWFAGWSQWVEATLRSNPTCIENKS